MIAEYPHTTKASLTFYNYLTPINLAPLQKPPHLSEIEFYLTLMQGALASIQWPNIFSLPYLPSVEKVSFTFNSQEAYYIPTRWDIAILGIFS